MVDTGLARSLSATFTEDRGRLLENAVYLELRKRHGRDSVFFYKGDKECDFIVKERIKQRRRYKVVYSLDQDNEKRETAGLTDAMEKLDMQKD